jgi:hypothetical protein
LPLASLGLDFAADDELAHNLRFLSRPAGQAFGLACRTVADKNERNAECNESGNHDVPPK